MTLALFLADAIVAVLFRHDACGTWEAGRATDHVRIGGEEP